MADKLIFEMEIEAKMDKALDEVKEVNKNTKEINENLSDIKKSGKIAEKGLKGIAKGFKGIGLAMKAGGFFLITEAFKFLKDIMMQNQRVMDGVTIATEALSKVFNVLVTSAIDLGSSIVDAFSNPQEAVEGLWDTIKENIVNRFEGFIDSFKALGKVIEGAFSLDWDLLKEGASDYSTSLVQVYTGLDEVQQAEAWELMKNGVNTIIETGKEAVNTATKITELRNSVKQLEAEQRLLNFTYLKEQETQRQIRDDISKTFEERMEANKLLGESLEKQLEDEKAILDEKLKLAKLESDADTENVDKKAEVTNALAELADLEERINGFRSEQIVNRVALEQEQKDALNELKLAEMTEKEAEFEALKQEYEAKLELARKAGVDTLEIDKQYEQSVKDLKLKNQQEIDDELAKQKAEQDKIDAKAQKDKLKAEEFQAKAKIDMQKKAYGMAKGLFAENEKVQKAFALGEIGIDTARAISSLTANSEGNPANALTFGGAGILQFGVGMLRILANIKSAKSLLSGKGSTPSTDSGGGSAGAGASASAPTPTQAQEVPQFDLAGSVDMFQQQPVQAFVIQQDVQDQTELNQQIQNRATL